jgi:hypothetical protein
MEEVDSTAVAVVIVNQFSKPFMTI